MKTLYALLAAVALPLSALAAPARLPDFLSPADAEALQAVRAAAQRWTSVYLQADCWGGSSCRVSENNLRINLHGSRTGWGSFNFSGSAGNESVHFWADPSDNRDPRNGYFINGSMTNLRLSPSGNSYWLTGSIGRRSVSITFNRFGSGWSMYGQSGLNLNLSGFNQTINASGNVDLDQFGPSELAAFGAVLSVLASLPAAN